MPKIQGITDDGKPYRVSIRFKDGKRVSDRETAVRVKCPICGFLFWTWPSEDLHYCAPCIWQGRAPPNAKKP